MGASDPAIQLLIYSHADEPITKALLSSAFIQKNDDLINLHLKALLNEVSIIDEFDHEEVKIDWTFYSGLRITNSLSFERDRIVAKAFSVKYCIAGYEGNKKC